MPTPSPTAHRERLERLFTAHRALIERPNSVDPTWHNGVFERFQHPVLSAAHTPPTWRYDCDPATNPRLLERLGINAVFNAGAMLWQDKVVVMARVEGSDRKSFFALAESDNGTEGFRFRDLPVRMPEDPADPETNVYDMRLTAHEDGWLYGLFCVERKDPEAPPGDVSSATAQCGIARSRDLVTWERLPDLASRSPQQRNVVLHPEFVQGRYLLYTRPQDGFIDAGEGSGICYAFAESMENCRIDHEQVVDGRVYHTIKEAKNGAGAPPLRTDKGWLHVAHGVRACAAGLRYVLYAFLCDLREPWNVIARPGGYLLAPEGPERIGDVSNVVFLNGLVERPNGEVLLYYASSDTRLHVARTDRERLLDYVLNTPPDPLRTQACVDQRRDLIGRNEAYLRRIRFPGFDPQIRPQARPAY